MEADWSEVTRIQLPQPPNTGPSTDGTFPRPVTALAFDTEQELLWTGTEKGRVISFYGTQLQKYTSFQIHGDNDGPVRQFLFHQKGVIALGPGTVHMAVRRGLYVWNAQDVDMVDLRCMTFTSRGTSELVVAGWQPRMLVLDVNKGEVVRRVETGAGRHYTTIKAGGRWLCAATRAGTVDLLDPTTLRLHRSWQAHVAYIRDMDAQSDFIVTCGGSMKQQAGSTPMLDPYVNVFDLKNMTSMSPIPFPPLAAHVRMHPRMLTTALVVSQQAQMQVVDLLNPATTSVRYANILSLLQQVEVAPTGEALAMVDSEGNIRLWGAPQKMRFAPLSKPTIFADPSDPAALSDAGTGLDWADDSATPLNVVGMPFYREMLLSALPWVVEEPSVAPPQYPDPAVLARLTKTEWGYHGRYHPSQLVVEGGLAAAPKFLSERARESAMNAADQEQQAGATAPAEVRAAHQQLALVARASTSSANSPAPPDAESTLTEAPAMYANFDIKYSKFGVDDFDFKFYNKTRYAGLENHMPNSYANALLQVLHFAPLVRNLALQHTARACQTDPCLLCELGFIFDMLDKADGSTCQATNLFKALSGTSGAGQLGLLEEEVHENTLTGRVQGLTRFLLDRISQDYRSIAPASMALEQALFDLPPERLDRQDILTRVLASLTVASIKCLHCKNESARQGQTLVSDLMYPTAVHRPAMASNIAGKGMPKPNVASSISFSQVLKASIERETTAKGWCSKCTRYQSLQTRRAILSVPAVLTLNAMIPESREDVRRLWATPGWLPEEIGIIVDGGQFYCFEGGDLQWHLIRGAHNISVYSLAGMVVHVESGKPAIPHLVGMVNVAHSASPAPPPTPDGHWHLFNDFYVRPVKKREALSFNAAWKLPSTLVFQLRAANNLVNTEWKKRIDASILFQGPPQGLLPLSHPVSGSGKADRRTYEALDPSSEFPGSDTIVALDTEFVSLKQAEIQVSSNGAVETIRPMSHALARVSVVRGQGEREGVAFIDDYIAIREPIVDHLTLYSGITPGDLDPRTSRHSLISLKAAYKKLWVLVNLGCKFLGHGLKQDFRVINMQVPRAQVIDTIELFYLKARLRRLSLAFLAWYLLKEDIQLETHDSIEDARTALKLYRKYLEFKEAGVLETMLLDIYRVGRETGFKPQRKEDAEVKRTETPPVVDREGPDGTTTPAKTKVAVGG